MSDIKTEALDKIRRSLTQEFVRMEDDFDTTRSRRKELLDKLMTVASGVKLTNEQGATDEGTDTGLRIINTALKALSDTEKANTQAITLKLKQSEQAIASSAAARDRIAIMLQATAPGRLEQSFPAEDLEKQLADLFDSEIQDFETKTSPRDLSE